MTSFLFTGLTSLTLQSERSHKPQDASCPPVQRLSDKSYYKMKRHLLDG